MGSRTRPLIIAGMHRSGTSLVAGYLHRCGVHMGDSLLNGDVSNPHGYYEDTRMLDLQRRMVRAASSGGTGGWPDWGFTGDGHWDARRLEDFAAESEELVTSLRREQAWGWKDPRSTLLLDFWATRLPDASFLLLFRDPWEVEASCHDSGADVFAKDPSFASRAWIFYNQRLLTFHRQHKDRCVLASANAFLHQPHALVALLRERFELELAASPAAEASLDPALMRPRVSFAGLDRFRSDPVAVDILQRLQQDADLPSDVSRPGEVRVSIIVPTHNDGRYLEEALASVERRLFRDYEIIVSDDGSTDTQTLDELARAEARGHIVLRNPHRGVAATRNEAVRHARAPYILPLDADNMIEPAYIDAAIEILDAQPGLGFVYAQPRLFGNSFARRTAPDFSLPSLLAANYIDTCAVIRKSAFERVGGFDAHMPDQLGYEDWELWIRMASAGWPGQRLDAFLFHYRTRSGSLVAGCNIPENRRRLVAYMTRKHAALYAGHAPHVAAELHALLAMQEGIAAGLQQRIPALEKDVVAMQDRSAAATHRLRQEHQAQEQHLIEARLRSDEIVSARDSHVAALAAEVQSLRAHIARIEDTLVWRTRTVLAGLMARRTDKPATRAPSAWRHVQLGVRRFLTLGFKRLYLWMEAQSADVIDHALLPSPDPGVNSLAIRPLFSIVMPVYNTPPAVLMDAIESVRRQGYPDWELCIADDRSTAPGLKRLLKRIAKADNRIKVTFRKSNGHIVACSNSAAALATGDYLFFMDHDDMIADTALFEMAAAINRQPEADILYADEDKINADGWHHDPHLKPDWCPDNLLSRNYLGHPVVIKTTLFREIGGFRAGFEGSQDYDLILRATERTSKVLHVPRLLYHWRVVAGSVADDCYAKPYAYDAARKAIEEALVRRAEPGVVTMLHPGYYRIRYQIREPRKVSIIIPARNQSAVLDTCLRSIRERTTWRNYEILVIDHMSDEPEFFRVLRDAQAAGMPLRWVRATGPFNFSRLVNLGAASTDGGFLLFLNNDTEIITPDWIEGLVEHAQRKSVGAVGVKLLYPDHKVQHAGVIMGLSGGVADHAFTGLPDDHPGYFYYPHVVSNFSAVTAACMMVRRSLFDEAGGFDEQLPVEFNDTDFCLRVREMGYQNVCVPHVKVYHYESLSRGKPEAKPRSDIPSDGEVFAKRWPAYIHHDPCFHPALREDPSRHAVRG